MQIAIGVIIVLVLALIGLVIWLSRSRTAEVKAKTETKELKRAQKARQKGDAVMAEPVADEDAWLASARQRLGSKLRDARRQ